mmetsp:Transcript_27042/g.41772  ORF Transcript_27042/g.41772 Transcript_27042/m.41772 type:complete len:263 (+) Transcript_27042:88-876(+)
MLKLLYLPLRARAEALRMLLSHASVPFVNEVIQFSDWPQVKPTVPNNQLPQLQLYDDTLLPHTKDIALHIAKLVGPPLLPMNEAGKASALHCWRELHTTSLPFLEDPWGDATPVDARIGAVNPLLNFLPEDEALPLIPKYLAGLPPWLESLEESLQRHPEGPFLGGYTPHHGDFATFHICDNITTLAGVAILNSGSTAGAASRLNLIAWMGAMRALPAVASYVRARPQAGTGAVGKPGSLIHRHAVPAAVVKKYLEATSLVT